MYEHDSRSEIAILKIEELDDATQFEDLKYVWNGVLSKSRDNEIFSTWEWLSCWWKHFGNSRKLRILTVKDGDEIIAIAPLMLSKYNFLHFGKIRKIEFIGSPQSDYNNFVLARKETECLKLFLDYLMENCSDWDYLQLTDICENSASTSLPNIYTDAPVDCVVANTCPYIDLPQSTNAFMKKLSRNMRRNLHKRMQRLRRDYTVKIKTHKNFNSVKEAMDVFFQLHQKRWNLKGEMGAFAQKEMHDLHTDVAEVFAEKGWLSLYFLTANDQPIAAVYSFDYGLKKYGYLTGFDPEYQSYSVGNLLKKHVVEDCIQRGLKTYDLTRGDEPYKLDWANQSKRNFEIRIVRKGLFAKMYSLATKNESIVTFMQKLGKSLSLEH